MVESSRRPLVTVVLALSMAVALPVPASDHSDIPQMLSTQRVDANLSDLHAFVKGFNLVIALSTNVDRKSVV